MKRLFTAALLLFFSTPALAEDVPPYPAPELAGIQAWINSKPLTIRALRGRAVLVDFWTYSCINCIRSFPHLIDWDKKYRSQGLTIIGVHSPEFGFEKMPDNIQAAVTKRGITYPVAQDNAMETWKAYGNRFWPAEYLIDKEGKIVYTHFGEGDYDVTENRIRDLLGIADRAEAGPEDEVPSSKGQTRETYLGTTRAANESKDGTLPLHRWALSGAWTREPEKIVSQKSGATVRLHFQARKVFLVLGTAYGKPVDATIRVDGGEARTIVVGKNDIYDLVDLGEPKEATIEITAGRPGLEAYAFTFGG